MSKYIKSIFQSEINSYVMMSCIRANFGRLYCVLNQNNFCEFMYLIREYCQLVVDLTDSNLEDIQTSKAIEASLEPEIRYVYVSFCICN